MAGATPGRRTRRIAGRQPLRPWTIRSEEEQELVQRKLALHRMRAGDCPRLKVLGHAMVR
jgi:hypothetical protein